jgi:hypothetical protein
MRVRAPRRVIVAIVMGIGMLAACGSNNGPSGPSLTPTTNNSNTVGQGVAPGTPLFTESPLSVDLISSIVPIGNLNPPDHTLPTNHSYFFHSSTADAEVRSPAGGTIGTVQRGSVDDQLYVTVSPGFDYYLAHLRLDASVAQGGKLTAGQRVGVTASAAGAAGAMDLGVINSAVTLFFVRPERYIAGTLHGDSPLKYFSEAVRSSLYAKVARSGGDKDGRIDFDLTGRLAGNWFTPDLQPLSATENFGNGPKHLAFVRDVNDPSLVRISIGGSLSMAGAYYVQPGAPDPADVSPASGKVAYQLYFVPQAQQPAGIMIVQMTADDRIQVQTFPPGTPLSADFTGAAVGYVR